MLSACDVPLADRFDLAMLDLDGVVYIGGAAVRGAGDAIASARVAGMSVAFITNNASRPPEVVADHLVRIGVPAAAGDVVTSAQAAARVVAQRHGRGARVLLLGGEGLRSALRANRLTVVDGAEEADVLVTGYGPDVRWREIMSAAVRVAGGLPWVASNADYTIPTPEGIAPGHGVLVQTLTAFTGVEPTVAGKPERPLIDETVRRIGGRAPLMVGDRLDTDIEGAQRAGVPSLLVLTGVTGLAELVAAVPEQRPSFIAADLGGLLGVHPAPTRSRTGWQLGGWRAEVADGALRVAPTQPPPTPGGRDAIDAWRVAAVAAWEHRDRTGAAPDIADVTLARLDGTER